MLIPGDTTMHLEETDPIKPLKKRRQGFDSEMRTIMTQRNNVKKLMTTWKSKSSNDHKSSAEKKRRNLTKRVKSSSQKQQQSNHFFRNEKKKGNCIQNAYDGNVFALAEKYFNAKSKRSLSARKRAAVVSPCPISCMKDDNFVTFEKLKGHLTDSETEEGVRTPKTSNRDQSLTSSFSHENSSCVTFETSSTSSDGDTGILPRECDCSDGLEDFMLLNEVDCAEKVECKKNGSGIAKHISPRKCIRNDDCAQMPPENNRSKYTYVSKPTIGKEPPLSIEDKPRRDNVPSNHGTILLSSQTPRRKLKKQEISKSVKNKAHTFVGKMSNKSCFPENSSCVKKKTSRMDKKPLQNPAKKITKKVPSFVDRLSKKRTNPSITRRQTIDNVKDHIARSQTINSRKKASISSDLNSKKRSNASPPGQVVPKTSKLPLPQDIKSKIVLLRSCGLRGKNSRDNFNFCRNKCNDDDSGAFHLLDADALDLEDILFEYEKKQKGKHKSMKETNKKLSHDIINSLLKCDTGMKHQCWDYDTVKIDGKTIAGKDGFLVQKEVSWRKNKAFHVVHVNALVQFSSSCKDQALKFVDNMMTIWVKDYRVSKSCYFD